MSIPFWKHCIYIFISYVKLMKCVIILCHKGKKKPEDVPVSMQYNVILHVLDNSRSMGLISFTKIKSRIT